MDLLEREPHLNIFSNMLKGLQTQALTGRLVFVSGEAGIGKTSLVRHFTQKAGTVVLWGMCDPLITPRPLAPLVDILQQTHSDLFKLLQSSSDHFPVFSGFLNELKQNPDVTVVVIEDVHWADSATLDLVKYLGRRIEQTRTLLILTYRDDEVGSNHPLQAVVGDLFRLETVQRMMLPRLSPEAVVSLTANTTFQSDIIYQLTDGNPFFVTELLADNRPDQIPATIRDAVLARKSRLSLSAQSILGIAAVIGAKSEPWLLADLASAETDAIEACLSSGILQVQEGLYIFRHELSRQAILSAILPHHKQVVHRLVFDALEASEMGRKDVARLAYHAEGAGDVFKLKQYALAAAEEASAVGAFHTVREQYQRILQSGASLSRDERADLLEAYAQVCLLTDHIEQAINANQEALGIWQEIGNRQREGACLSKQANCYFVDAQPDAADRASLDAIAILESLDTTQALAAAYGVEAALRMLNRDVEDAIRWGHKALKIAQQFQDSAVVSSALNAIGSATLLLDYDRGCELLTQSLDVARQTGNKVNIARAYGNLASGSGEVYQFHKAERYADEGLAFAAEHDLDNHYQYMMAWQALTHMYLGKWLAAAEAAWEVLDRQNVATYTRVMMLVALGRLRTRRGDPGAAAVLDEALELALKTKHLQRIAPVRAARAEMYWYQGNYVQMVREAQSAFDLALHYRHPWFIGELAYWQWRGNRLDNLPKAIAEPFVAQIVGDVERAARLWEERGCPYERAIALSDSPVEDDLLNALQIVLDLDAKPAIAMVQQNLRQIGSNKILRGPRDATRANPAGLTNRQLQVLKLLADELTNNEIAHRLFISPKTVEHHISTILSKLNVQSRHEATNFAHEHDLLDPK